LRQGKKKRETNKRVQTPPPVNGGGKGATTEQGLNMVATCPMKGKEKATVGVSVPRPEKLRGERRETFELG